MVRNTGESFIDEEGITIASMSSFQAACIEGTELDTPKPDRLSSDDDASLSQEVFDIAVAKIESVVEPEGIADDI